MYVTVP